MNSIGQHISNVRSLINQYGRTQESYTDQFLYQLIVGARNEILKNKIRQGHKIPESNYYNICMKLELVRADDCSCVPDEISCKVLRTKYPVPTVLSNRDREMLTVFLLNGKEISLTTVKRWRMVKEVSDNLYIASFRNNYLYFWNLPTNIKVVEITGLFTDPLDFSSIPDCNSLTGEEGQCSTFWETPFPIDEEYKLIVYQKCLELLSITIPTKADITNNSTNVPTQV